MTEGPVARGHLAMTSLDHDLGVMLFGGVTAPPPDWEILTDTWTMAEAGDGWLQVDATVSVGGDTIAYDSNSGQIILYTAWSGPSETWAYSLEADEWTQMSTEGVPQGLWAPHLIYDSESDVMILIGPPDPSPRPENATWTYEFDTDTWTEMGSASVMPKRWFPAMAYDAGSDRVIVFGGFNATEEPLGDTWVYDYNSDTWTDMAPAHSPPARGYSAMAYDPISDRTILFGGSTHPDPLDDTWAYDYSTNSWIELSPDTAPSTRDRHMMAFNPIDQTIVMFGGATILGSGPDWKALPAETWIFNPADQSWSLRS